MNFLTFTFTLIHKVNNIKQGKPLLLKISEFKRCFVPIKLHIKEKNNKNIGKTERYKK